MTVENVTAGLFSGLEYDMFTGGAIIGQGVSFFF
jgi:hypothetical protein